MMTSYTRRNIRRKFCQFCRHNNVNPEDILGYCEGSLSNFPMWYADYLRYIRNEIRNRIKTGKVTPIKFEDVWS